MRNYRAWGVVVLVACNPRASAVHEEAGAVATVVPKASPPPETDFEKLSKLTTAEQAVAFTKPKMEDPMNKMGSGHALLALWSVKRLNWVDVAVAKNETTFASVLKDAEEARGKRLCVQGSIVEIEVEKTSEGKVFDGLLHDYARNIYKFSAVGSSGDLVGGSQSRFCGIITGKFDYSNSGGGTGHAIKLVGMFDLPANKVAR